MTMKQLDDFTGLGKVLGAGMMVNQRKMVLAVLLRCKFRPEKMFPIYKRLL